MIRVTVLKKSLKLGIGGQTRIHMLFPTMGGFMRFGETDISHLSPIMSHHQPIMSHLPPIMSHLPPIMSHLPPIMSHLSPIMSTQATPIMSHLPPIMSTHPPIMSHLPPIAIMVPPPTTCNNFPLPLMTVITSPLPPTVITFQQI